MYEISEFYDAFFLKVLHLPILQTKHPLFEVFRREDKKRGVGKRDEGKSMKSKKKGGNRRDGNGEKKRSEKEVEAKI